MSTRKHISVSLPIQFYNQVKLAAKRQGISIAEYGGLALSWYWATSETGKNRRKKGTPYHRRGPGNAL